ncbi:Uncharacterised protein [Clostridium perfringens]|uniref:Uncharacterized protein n=1 Tax=Clostridium perfringens TaxID=1502 RepID=A0A2X3HYD9_CLOPF|nr:hypothetical protein [Clostridium perfringens]SQC85212.1 Uncharacterised protein [Clostridium perfringens]
MKKMKIIALTTGLMLTIISTNVFAYDGYSLYADNIKNESILKNNVRLKGIDKSVNGNNLMLLLTSIMIKIKQFQEIILIVLLNMIMMKRIKLNL